MVIGIPSRGSRWILSSNESWFLNESWCGTEQYQSSSGGWLVELKASSERNHQYKTKGTPMRSCILIIFSSSVCLVAPHGHITFPPSRTNASLESAGDCRSFSCFWFSQLSEIPGTPTINDAAYRTMNVDVKSGPTDWSRKNPWRAAGTAPVSGSGCGIAGGSKLKNMTGNGGVPPPGYNFGDDYLTQPKTKQTTWKRGQPQMVAWAALANHGGGYSWRLCKADGTVDEA
jgi:hypothetical protein